MGRVSGSAVQPMNTLGDLAYGGGGSPTGYLNVAKTALGATAMSVKGTFSGAIANVLDGNPLTYTVISGAPPNSDIGVDLGSPQRIGRVRYLGTQPAEAASIDVQSSTDNVTWTTRMTTTAAAALGDTGLLDTPAPITARYWRFNVMVGPGQIGVAEIEVYAVTTVGAGNPTRLAPPAERRLLGFDPDSGVPQWQEPGAAIDDLAAAVGVDVAAATGTQVAKKTELDATNTALNSLLAELRAAGVLAP